MADDSVRATLRDSVREAETLRDGAAALGVRLTSRSLPQLLSYIRLLEHWNKTFNLVSRKDMDRLVTRHLLDSLSVLPWLQGPRVMDLGTGAGLPGIPLAIARPDLSFTLIDRSDRKIRFLTEVIGELNLANVLLCCQNAKAGAGQEKFSTVTARAVAPALDVWRLTSDRLEEGGRLILLNRVFRDVAGLLEVVFPGGAAEQVEIQIPGIAEAHGVMIVERC
ncbi:MAG: 16S rRNA (guanine(527)-N(7))-methyltransferase RsmG [Gammaproteobacteria bacterium]|nr:16S rRNA (guanine(527)-N(7))-methyltransferase RsmG [Gammaproteobacteria bacterium]